MSSDYDFVQKGSLKLKGVSDGGIKKKKKSKSKNKDREEPKVSKEVLESASGSNELLEGASRSMSSSSKGKNEADAEKYYQNKTKSEIAFLKRKEKSDIERIRKKGSESHKERVEKFNDYLNSLSEHYEPAKVSWTK